MRAAALESLEYRLERENLAEPIPDEPCSLWKLTFPDHLPLSLTKTLISARSSVKKTAPSPIPLFWYLDISGYSRGNGLKRISSRRDERKRERENKRKRRTFAYLSKTSTWRRLLNDRYSARWLDNRGIKREGDREGDCLSLRTIGM